ncbi:MAG: methyltransferase domain-containing protein [Desulfobacterales bacterium]|nr:methyltransferase domain-containing protein [Desulfobacterales bacterium]
MLNNSQDFLNFIIQTSQKPYPDRKSEERKIAHYASSHLEDISYLLEKEDVYTRRFLVEILRKTKPTKRSIELLLARLLTDEDVKIRRRAAAGLGETGNKSLHQQLISAFNKEEHRFVKASIILALGSLDFKWSQEWEALCGEKGPIAEAFRKANARGNSESAKKNIKSINLIPYPANSYYMLECYQGVEAFVLSELQMPSKNIQGRIIEPGWIYIDKLLKNNPEYLGKLRTVLSSYAIASKKQIKSLDEEAITNFLIDECKNINLSNTSNVTFRLQLPKMKTRTHYRDVITKMANLMAHKLDLVNNPYHFILDFRVIYINNTAYLLWRDTRWQSERYPKNRFVIPASIHPTVGASLCIASEIKPDDIVCDVCCGAGTILFERLKMSSAHKVLGFDLSSEAIKLCKKNLSIFKEKFLTAIADMRRLPLENNSVNVVIANLPFGIRVGERNKNKELYANFLKETKRILLPNGRIIAYTHDTASFESACKMLNWKNIHRIAEVQAGGLTITIYKGAKIQT